MKKLLLLFASSAISLVGCSQDTIQNKNSGGNAGFVAISGTDIVIMQLDSNKLFYSNGRIGIRCPQIETKMVIIPDRNNIKTFCIQRSN